MLRDDLKSKILLFDGAIDTQLQKHNPVDSDFPGNKQGFNDGLNVTHPEWLQVVYRNYLESGADCITTNTFGSNKIKLDEYGFGDQTADFNKNAASLARTVADLFDNKYVIGSMGPSGYMPTMKNPPEVEMSLDDLENAFYLQASGLIRGGVDALVLETSQDILELKTAMSAIKRTDTDIPIFANITLAQANKMLMGTSTESAYVTISGMGIDVFGLNCNTGPEEMINSIQWRDENSSHPLLVVPNAGIPDMDNADEYPLQPAEMVNIMSDIIQKYRSIRIIGGCCGTTPDHIHSLRDVIDKQR